MTENSRLIVIYSVRATQRQPLCPYTECVDDNMKPTKIPLPDYVSNCIYFKSKQSPNTQFSGVNRDSN